MYKKRNAPAVRQHRTGATNKTVRTYCTRKAAKSQLRRDVLFGVIGTLVLFGGFFGVLWLHSFLVTLIGG